MKTQPILKKLTIAVGIALLGLSMGSVMADGTETLGTPIIAIQSGSGVVAAGTGMLSQPGVININVPGTVKQVLLYWEGQSIGSVGDNTIVVNGNAITGTSIGGPTHFFNSSGNAIYSTTYRKDITSLNLVGPGGNALNVSGLSFSFANNGAGVLVIFDDGSTSDVQVRDGNDLAFAGFTGLRNTTVPQTFNFTPAGVSRTATLPMFFSSVEGAASGNGTRSSAIKVTVGGVTTWFDNQLSSNDGDEWDTLTLPITVPAGASSLTVQALSLDRLSTNNLEASFAWNAAALAIEEDQPQGQGQGCTPGYWKQTQHFDSWTAPYTPNTLFSNVFENAFPGKTLLQVLQQGGGGLIALGRHTVAALLNAANPNVSYDLTVNDVIDQFNAVHPGTKAQYNTLKNTFAGFNEQGCPLN